VVLSPPAEHDLAFYYHHSAASETPHPVPERAPAAASTKPTFVPRPIEAAAATPPINNKCPPPPLFDYVEIGTSDFSTLLEEAIRNEKEDGRPRRGLSVEAMGIYLNRLPPAQGNLQKMNAAVLGFAPHASTIPVWFIDPENLVKHMDQLPLWLRGCNSVGKPHPQALKYITESGLQELYEIENVTLASVGEVLIEGGACRINKFKIDVEGLEANLMVGYVDFLWRHASCHANHIQFETIHAPPDDVLAARRALATVGYSDCGWELDGGGGQPDSILCYNEADDARVFWAARNAKDTPISEESMHLIFAEDKSTFRTIPEYMVLSKGVASTDCFWKHLY